MGILKQWERARNERRWSCLEVACCLRCMLKLPTEERWSRETPRAPGGSIIIWKSSGRQPCLFLVQQSRAGTFRESTSTWPADRLILLLSSSSHNGLLLHYIQPWATIIFLELLPDCSPEPFHFDKFGCSTKVCIMYHKPFSTPIWCIELTASWRV